MGLRLHHTMKTVYICLTVLIGFDTFRSIDGQLFFIDKEPVNKPALEDESCECSRVLPFDLSKTDAKSLKLRNEINKKFEIEYEPKNPDNGATDDNNSNTDEEENTSQGVVDSLSRPKRSSKLVFTKTKTPSFIWGNMLSIHSVGPIKKLIRTTGDTGFEIKEFEMKEINAEKFKTPFKSLHKRLKRASSSKFPKRIRISVKDIKMPRGPKAKVVKKRSIFDDQYPECPAIQNLRHRKDLNHNDLVLQYLPEVGSDCPACGSTYMNQHTMGCECGGCIQCGCVAPAAIVQHRPHYIEYNGDGTPVTYVPGRVDPYNPMAKSSPRYVFDQFGHRYLENNGNLRIVVPDHFVGAVPPTYPGDHDEENMYFNKIREVLYGYKDFANWNSQNEKGELAPAVLDQQRDVLKLLQEIVKNRYNSADHIPVTVENAFNDTNDAAYQTNKLFVDEDVDEDNVKKNEIDIK